MALVTEKTVAWAWPSLKQVRKHSLAAGWSSEARVGEWKELQWGVAGASLKSHEVTDVQVQKQGCVVRATCDRTPVLAITHPLSLSC